MSGAGPQKVLKLWEVMKKMKYERGHEGDEV
jgi:hypothetical protein